MCSSEAELAYVALVPAENGVQALLQALQPHGRAALGIVVGSLKLRHETRQQERAFG